MVTALFCNKNFGGKKEIKIGKVKTKTLQKFILLVDLTLEQRNIATIIQIMLALGCSRGTAYNYRRALRCILPDTFPPKASSASHA
jgi:hypothetical protein